MVVLHLHLHILGNLQAAYTIIAYLVKNKTFSHKSDVELHLIFHIMMITLHKTYKLANMPFTFIIYMELNNLLSQLADIILNYLWLY